MDHHPIIRSSLGAAERQLLAELCRKGVSLAQLEQALVLGLSRKYVAFLNRTASTPIYSLSYFLPLLEEVAQSQASDHYWQYLRRRLEQLNATWCQRSRSITLPAGGNCSSPASAQPATADP